MLVDPVRQRQRRVDAAAGGLRPKSTSVATLLRRRRRAAERNAGLRSLPRGSTCPTEGSGRTRLFRVAYVDRRRGAPGSGGARGVREVDETARLPANDSASGVRAR